LYLCSENSALDSLKGSEAKSFVYIHYNKEGISQWRLEGDSATYSADSKTAVTNPTLEFFFVQGAITIKANQALIAGDAKACQMMGNVHAQSVLNRHVRTEQADIDLQSQTVNFPVKFEAKDELSTLSAERGSLELHPYLLTTFGFSELDYQP